jgi:subtilisin family serine protease
VLLLALVTASIAIGAGQEARLGHYMVVLHDSVDHPGAVGHAQTDQYGGHLGFVYRYGPIGYSATLPEAAVEALSRDPRVRDVRVDHREDVAGAQKQSTGIKRVLATSNAKLEIDEEDNFTVDADVAVIDTGVDHKHPDLEVVSRTYCDGNEKSASCTDETGTDEDGHGTTVAGVIAARDNTEGVVGVAPGARIWSVKVLDAKANWESEVVAGINWVTSHSDYIEVANMSIQCLELPCKRKTMSEAVTASVEAGVVYVGIAGNQGEDASQSGYATQPEMITTSALADYDGLPEMKAPELWTPSCQVEKQKEDEEHHGEDDTLAEFSNWGKDVEMTAPGVCIYTTDRNSGYTYTWGTSIAAPHVSGAAAILAAQSDPETKADVMEIRETLMGAGNFTWVDSSADGYWEPLLDVHDEEIFK